MTQFSALKLGVAGIAIVLSISISVVTENVQSISTETSRTPRNFTVAFHGQVTEHSRAESTTFSNHKAPIVQLSEIDQQIEELLVTTQDQAVTLATEGSGEELPSNTSYLDDVTTFQLPDLSFAQEVLKVTTEEPTTISETSPMTSSIPLNIPLVPEAGSADTPHTERTTTNVTGIPDTHGSNIFEQVTAQQEQITTAMDVISPNITVITTTKVPESTTTATKIPESTTASMISTPIGDVPETIMVNVTTAMPVPKSITPSGATPTQIPESTIASATISIAADVPETTIATAIIATQVPISSASSAATTTTKRPESTTASATTTIRVPEATTTSSATTTTKVPESAMTSATTTTKVPGTTMTSATTMKASFHVPTSIPPVASTEQELHEIAVTSAFLTEEPTTQLSETASEHETAIAITNQTLAETDSASQVPDETSQTAEDDDYSTHASSIVEHIIPEHSTIMTAVPAPTTIGRDTTTAASPMPEFEDKVVTSEATTIGEQVPVTTLKVDSEETVTVMTKTISETTLASFQNHSDSPSSLPPETVPKQVNVGAVINDTQSTDKVSTSIPVSETTFGMTNFTEYSTEKVTPLQSKSYDKLNEPEFFNSVTTVFTLPPRMKGLLFDKDTFKEKVICLINIYEAQGWFTSVHNVSQCEDDNNELDPNSKLLLTSDFVIIEPSPKLNNNEIVVSFFIRNNTSEYSGKIVSRNRTLCVLNNHKEFLANQMGMNITEIYGGMRISHLIAPTTEPFYMRHSLLLIILMVVAGVCILIIISGLVYIKCRSKQNKWGSTTSSYTHEKSKLQRDMLCSEMGQHLNSDDDINKDETLRAMNNGNGFFGTDNGSGSSVIPIGDEDGWVIPYDELTPDEKATVDVEDTKL